jgi:hypothetical protein
MRFIDHQPGTILLAQCNNLGKIDDVPIHTEHRIRHDKLGCLIASLLQSRLQGLHIVVQKPQKLGP